MCLTKNTMAFIDKYEFSDEDKAFVIDAYDTIWKNLDHSIHYCLNPGLLCAEILRRCGRTSYDKYNYKNINNAKKVARYDENMILIMDALNATQEK